jgi:hypothetical protein
MRALEKCPSCGSGDVGAASGIAHCYKCKDEVRAATTREACEKWNVRAIFLRNGFEIKPGNTDLKPYVYEAAAELIARYRRWSVPAPLAEYHEDFGPVVWWAWNAELSAWLGEPSWMGQPDDSDWPGYHTHFTLHPEFPDVPARENGNG